MNVGLAGDDTHGGTFPVSLFIERPVSFRKIPENSGCFPLSAGGLGCASRPVPYLSEHEQNLKRSSR